MKRRIVLSVLLVLLGGLYSLAMGIIASRSMWVLLAIVPILWAIASTSAREKSPRGKALLFGAILCACYVLIGTIVFYRDAVKYRQVRGGVFLIVKELLVNLLTSKMLDHAIDQTFGARNSTVRLLIQ